MDNEKNNSLDYRKMFGLRIRKLNTSKEWIIGLF